jgi:DNA polymerase elongation subunit (family B)
MIKKLKSLVLDIETSPMLAYVWGLKDQHLSPQHIAKDWHVMAWCAKWLEEPATKLIYRDQRSSKDPSDDKKILQELWSLLDDADRVITQNGQEFDGPKLNARFIKLGFNPPSPYRHIDTYRIASNIARFTSNKLEYLTANLCTKYKKLSHKKYPGLSLWLECLKGNKDAWKEMERYNKHDVLSTEELYLKLRAWAPENYATAFAITDVQFECSTCGTKDVMRVGPVRFAKRDGKSIQYRQNSCLKCGSWQRGERIK